MNFIHGEIKQDNDMHFQAQEGAFRIPLNSDIISLLNEYKDRAVILGIRPEDLYVSGSSYVPESIAEIELVLDVIEPMGNEIFVYTRSGEDVVVARVAPQRMPSPGESIHLAIDLTKLHFFDVGTEKAIGLAKPETLAA